MRRRGDRQQVDDHRLVPPDQRVADVKCMPRRPVPVENLAVRCLAEPVPLHRPPERGDGLDNLALGLRAAREVLPRRQQALHQERRLHQVRAVVVRPEVRHGLAGASVEEVRPDAMKSVGAREEAENPHQPLGGRLARHEAALGPDDEGHDAEARGAERDEVLVARLDLERHPGIRMRAVPVVAEVRLLHHRQQFVVGERAGGGLHGGRWGRLVVAGIDSRNPVAGGAARSAEEVDVALAPRLLDSDRHERAAIVGTVDAVMQEVGGR